MHIALDPGHNTPPADTGAIGLASEDGLTLALATEMQKLLVEAGHKVTLCKVSKASSLVKSLNARVTLANRAGADLFVSLHFNKFLGSGQTTDKPMGSEVYVASKPGEMVAARVMKALTNLGFKIHDAPGNTGVKYKEYYVITHTNMPAILIESFYLDSKADYAVFQRESVGIKGLAAALVKALVG